MHLGGENLEQPMLVTWFASAENESGLHVAAEELKADFEFIQVRYHPRSDPRGGDDRWWLEAKRFTVPSVENLCTLRDRMKRVVEAQGAQYEGFARAGIP
jgi:hypothetical protein